MLSIFVHPFSSVDCMRKSFAQCSVSVMYEILNQVVHSLPCMYCSTGCSYALLSAAVG